MEQRNNEEPDSTSEPGQQRPTNGSGPGPGPSGVCATSTGGSQSDTDEHHHVYEEYVVKKFKKVTEHSRPREKMTYSWREICHKKSEISSSPWHSSSWSYKPESDDSENSDCVEECVEEEYKSTVVRMRGL